MNFTNATDLPAEAPAQAPMEQPFTNRVQVIRMIDSFHPNIQNDDNYFKWYVTQHVTKLDIDDFIALTTVTPTDFIRMYHWLIFDSFYVDENILFTERQRIILGNQFKCSKLKEELMATLWHPINFDKFHYWDPETFEFE
jgi:hypothetical protein